MCNLFVIMKAICVLGTCILGILAFESVNEKELRETVKKEVNVLVIFCDQDIGEQCMQVQQRVQNALESDPVPGLKTIVALDSVLAKEYQLKALPQLVYYRNQQPILYYADHTNNVELAEWIQRNQEFSTKQLNEDNFEHDTQASTGATTGDWFIMFYDSSECGWLVPTWEALASRMKQKLVVGTVDTKVNKKLKDRFKLNKCCTLIFFRHGSMYEYNLHTKDIPSLASFAEGWYKNVPAVKVPTEPTPFDKLTDNLAGILKDKLGRNSLVVGGACCGLLLLSLIICCCCMSSQTKGKAKTE